MAVGSVSVRLRKSEVFEIRGRIGLPIDKHR